MVGVSKAKADKEWVDLQTPGYFGKERDSKYLEWDKKYGKGNWRVVWKAGDKTLDFLGVCKIYEDAYYEFLKKNPQICAKLLKDASDVYDDAASNMKSKFDYSVQETNRTHIQDIVIRNAVRRLGLSFEGKDPVQIRGRGLYELSKTLEPGSVPFHRLDLIRQPELKGWWGEGTVEAFYQSNKVIQVKKSVLDKTLP
jgi:hypothetical protein